MASQTAGLLEVLDVKGGGVNGHERSHRGQRGLGVHAARGPRVLLHEKVSTTFLGVEARRTAIGWEATKLN